MKASFTRGALSDLDEILSRLESVNPLAAAAVERKIRAIIACIEEWPTSARAVTQWPGNVRAAALVRYPYVIFYQIKEDRIEILHVKHTARAPWGGPIG
jgi:toxin ParE1/3/4